jgi:hypothetical protein
VSEDENIGGFKFGQSVEITSTIMIVISLQIPHSTNCKRNRLQMNDRMWIGIWIRFFYA